MSNRASVFTFEDIVVRREIEGGSWVDHFGRMAHIMVTLSKPPDHLWIVVANSVLRGFGPWHKIESDSRPGMENCIILTIPCDQVRQSIGMTKPFVAAVNAAFREKYAAAIAAQAELNQIYREFKD